MKLPPQYAQSIVNEMKASIHRDINIMDEQGIILASTNPARRGTLHQGAARILREGLPSLTIREDDPAAGVQRGINLPITLDGRTVGVIGVTGDPSEVSVFGDIIKRMTEIMVEGVQRQEESDLLDRAKSLFVENWLFADSPDWPELELRGRLLGFDLNSTYRVALLQLEEGGQPGYERADDLREMRSGVILRLIQGRLQLDKGDYCAVLRSRIIVLLCRSSPAGALSLISRICQEIGSYYQLRVSGGISDTSRSPADIRRCYLQAQTAGAAAAQSPGGRVVFYDQVSLEFIAQSIPRPIRRDLTRLVFSSCSDQERAAFARTILLYFQEDGDLNRCARRSFVHRNTVQYHIDRIRQKTGYDLRVPRDSLLLYLAAQEGENGPAGEE